MIEQIAFLMRNYPKASLVIISLIVSAISMLITKKMTDQELLRSIKERQKEIQKEIKDKKYASTDKRFLKLQQEMLETSGIMIKHSFRPLLVTMIPFFLLFYFLKKFYIPLLGNQWFWYYLLPSLVVSPLYKKIFKIA